MTPEENLKDKLKEIDEDIDFCKTALEVHKKRKESLEVLIAQYQSNPTVAETVDKVFFEISTKRKLSSLNDLQELKDMLNETNVTTTTQQG